MKKPVLLLVVLAALVGFAAFYQQNRDKRVNSAKLVGAPDRALLLPNLPVGDVRKIRIKEGQNVTTLSAKESGWTVDERSAYPAAYERIQGVVTSLADLKIVGKQVLGKGALGEVKLLAPEEGAQDGSGLSVELMNEKGDLLASFIAGTTVESAGGASSGNFMGGPNPQRFVRIPKDENTVWLVADGLSDIVAQPQEWLDKNLVNVTRIKSVEVKMPVAEDSWKAERKDEASEFVFSESKNGDSLDTAKAANLGTILSNTTYVDVVPKQDVTPEFMKGALIVQITTFDGFTYDVQLVGRKGATETAEPKSYIKIAVKADLQKERTAAPDEKPEDKKAKDESFAAQKKTLEEKLAKEQLLEPWVYEVSEYVFAELVKKRSDLARDKNAPEGQASAPAATNPAIPQFRMRGPNGQIINAVPDVMPSPAPAPVPAPAPQAPVTVTTPPVSAESAKPAAPAPAAPEAKPKSE